MTARLISAPDGVELALHRVRAFRDGRPAVLLVHGAFTNHRFWLHSENGTGGMAHFLGAAGLDVWLADLRHHGESAREPRRGGGSARRGRHARDAGPAPARTHTEDARRLHDCPVARVGSLPGAGAALRQRRRGGGDHRGMDGVERARGVARDRWIRLLWRPGGGEYPVPRRGRERRSDLRATCGLPAGRRPRRIASQEARGRAGTDASWPGTVRPRSPVLLAERGRVAQGDAVTEAVLFDFNGVLVDDEAQHCEALQAILRDDAITMSREQYYADYLGLDDRTGFVEAFRRANRTLTTEILNRLVAAKSRRYLALVTKSLRLVLGATEFVRDAGRRYRLGIVSGALRREIDIVLRKSGLGDRFEIVIAADDVRHCKPDPAAYLAAQAAFTKRRAVAANACVAIEDSLPGLEAARAAGMACVMLTTNYPGSTFGGRGAALVWDSFSGHTAAELADL